MTFLSAAQPRARQRHAARTISAPTTCLATHRQLLHAEVDHNLSERDSSPAATSTTAAPATTPASSPIPAPIRATSAENQQQYYLRQLDPHHQSEPGERSPLHLHLPRNSTTSQHGAGRRLSQQARSQGRARQRVPAIRAGRLQHPGHQRAGAAAVSDRAASVWWTISPGCSGRHAHEIRRRGAARRAITSSTAHRLRRLHLSPPRPPACPATPPPGSGLASLLLGFPTSFAQKQTQELDRSSWYLAAFAQDDWTVTRSPDAELRRALGDRHADRGCEQPHERLRPAPDQSRLGHAGRSEIHGPERIPHHALRSDWNNFGPRFGFAWKPFGRRTVVRGGFGIFFAHPFDSGQPNRRPRFSTLGRSDHSR